MLDLSKLKPFLRENPPHFDIIFGRAWCGRRGPVDFIIAAHDDGYCTGSLSLGQRKPTDAHCNAFWRFATGSSDFPEEDGARNCRVFTLSTPEVDA